MSNMVWHQYPKTASGLLAKPIYSKIYIGDNCAFIIQFPIEHVLLPVVVADILGVVDVMDTADPLITQLPMTQLIRQKTIPIIRLIPAAVAALIVTLPQIINSVEDIGVLLVDVSHN